MKSRSCFWASQCRSWPSKLRVEVVCEVSWPSKQSVEVVCDVSGQLFAGGSPSTLTARSLISLAPSLLSLFWLFTQNRIRQGSVYNTWECCCSFKCSLGINQNLKGINKNLGVISFGAHVCHIFADGPFGAPHPSHFCWRVIWGPSQSRFCLRVIWGSTSVTFLLTGHSGPLVR